jgi:hypothetical protein
MQDAANAADPSPRRRAVRMIIAGAKLLVGVVILLRSLLDDGPC